MSALIALLTALRELPEDVDMIEHNPDDGPRYHCCGNEVRFHVHPTRWPAGSESREGRVHGRGCWYVQLVDALAAYDRSVE